ncbi:AIPR family protein [Listeria cornellensis]|uniref:AIPR family protein n=1 Tax=Listeria cornellensis TaxID=1494961 RepID=UPI0004AE4833|nr:AIPR family protein [Listeria cornellensis]
MLEIKMKVSENSFRELNDPLLNKKAAKYLFYVQVDDVSEGIPMTTNPRDQKLTSNVAKAIEDSLDSNDGYFHLKNRGIVLSAGKVDYDTQSKLVTIYFDDDDLHGNIDGGHTYRIVCEHIGEKLQQYVQFEVMTGVEDIIEKLAEARNTSVQVDEKSMAELANKFDPIKEGIQEMPFYNRIAFKQNQVTEDINNGKKLKMIDAREIVAIINMFNIEKFSDQKQPVQAYSSKGENVEHVPREPRRIS